MTKRRHYLPALIAVVLFFSLFHLLVIYSTPMEDVSLDLSLSTLDDLPDTAPRSSSTARAGASIPPGAKPGRS